MCFNNFDEYDLQIFDLDGTIANTEKYHWMAHNIVVSDFGIQLTDEDIKKYIGHNDKQIYSMICEDFNVDIDIDKAIEHKVDTFIRLAGEYNIKPFTPIKNIIENTKNRKVILSSQNERIINELLKLWGYEEKFEDIISLSQTKKTKLEVIQEKYGSYKVVVFEDTFRIIEELRDNGIRCIAVRNDYNKDLFNTGDADVIDEKGLCP